MHLIPRKNSKVVCYQYRASAVLLLDCKDQSRTPHSLACMFASYQSVCKGASCLTASIEWYPNSLILAHSIPMPDPTGFRGASHRQEQRRCYGLGTADRRPLVDRNRIFAELKYIISIPNAIAMHVPPSVQYHTTLYPAPVTRPSSRLILVITQSSVDLVERSRVVKAAIPHLVDDLLRMSLVLDLRSCLHGQLGASPYTGL